MIRNITGTIRKTSGGIWRDAVVEFELDRSAFDGEAQYPVRPVRTITGENGQINVPLWANEDSLRPCKYICTLPDGSQFRFVLEADAGVADLNSLRSDGIEQDSPHESDQAGLVNVIKNVCGRMIAQDYPIPDEIRNNKPHTLWIQPFTATIRMVDADSIESHSRAGLPVAKPTGMNLLYAELEGLRNGMNARSLGGATLAQSLIQPLKADAVEILAGARGYHVAGGDTLGQFICDCAAKAVLLVDAGQPVASPIPTGDLINLSPDFLAEMLNKGWNGTAEQLVTALRLLLQTFEQMRDDAAMVYETVDASENNRSAAVGQLSDIFDIVSSMLS
jgi:hypothetical protein